MATIDFGNLPAGACPMPYDDGKVMLWTFDMTGPAATADVDGRGLHLRYRSVMQFPAPADKVQLTVLAGTNADITAWILSGDGYRIADTRALAPSPRPQNVSFQVPGLVRVSTTANNELFLTVLTIEKEI